VQLAREAVSNVSRHAQATTCRVSLFEEGGSVVLEVDDDGRGFHPANVRPGGQGLGNLWERALAIGGRSRSTAIRAKGCGFGSSCLDRNHPATRASTIRAGVRPTRQSPT
jgi:signal transduction histidine kinase